MSWSCAASDADAMVWSVPITWKHTWFITSGITGLIFPGMMDDPGAAAGRLISLNPHRGPDESSRRSLQILLTLTATRRRMFEKSRNDDVDDDASMKSSGDRRGKRVCSLRAETDASAKDASAQILVPMAVPPRLSS